MWNCPRRGWRRRQRQGDEGEDDTRWGKGRRYRRWWWQGKGDMRLVQGEGGGVGKEKGRHFFNFFYK